MLRDHKESGLDKPRKSAEQFLNRVEKYIEPATDSKCIDRIIVNLNLHSFESRDKEFALFLKKLKTESIDMTLFLGKLKRAMLDNEPLCLLLAFIQDNKLISDKELESAANTLQLQINLLSIFEAFTITMANSETLAEDVYRHITGRRNSYAPGNAFSTFFFGMPRSSTFFERLKIISIDPGMLQIIFNKSTGERDSTPEDLKDFIQRFNLSGLNTKLSVNKVGNQSTISISGMGLNILEAAWEDSTGHSKNAGGKENAEAGAALIGLMEQKAYLTRDMLRSYILPEGLSCEEKRIYPLLPGLTINLTPKKTSEFKIDFEWRNLYNSWNLRFVIGNIDSVILPIKLLLPSIFCAAPENYKELRTMSLYLTANLFINETTLENPFFSNEFCIENNKKILIEWSKINKQYASNLLDKFCPDAKTSPEKLYSTIFGKHPTFNLMKNLGIFFYHTDDFRCTTNGRKQTNKSVASTKM